MAVEIVGSEAVSLRRKFDADAQDLCRRITTDQRQIILQDPETLAVLIAVRCPTPDDMYALTQGGLIAMGLTAPNGKE